jgi:hypothetical protein
MGQPEIATQAQNEKPLRELWTAMVQRTPGFLPSDIQNAIKLDYELIEKTMECIDVDQFFAMLPTIDAAIKPGRFDKDHLDDFSNQKHPDGLPYEYILALKVLQNAICEGSGWVDGFRQGVLAVCKKN